MLSKESHQRGGTKKLDASGPLDAGEKKPDLREEKKGKKKELGSNHHLSSKKERGPGSSGYGGKQRRGVMVPKGTGGSNLILVRGVGGNRLGCLKSSHKTTKSKSKIQEKKKDPQKHLKRS